MQQNVVEKLSKDLDSIVQMMTVILDSNKIKKLKPEFGYMKTSESLDKCVHYDRNHQSINSARLRKERCSFSIMLRKYYCFSEVY